MLSRLSKIEHEAEHLRFATSTPRSGAALAAEPRRRGAQAALRGPAAEVPRGAGGAHGGARRRSAAEPGAGDGAAESTRGSGTEGGGVARMEGRDVRSAKPEGDVEPKRKGLGLRA